MKLSISNIAWPAEWDESVYSAMEQLGYQGLEIAPTRIFPEQPYEDLERVKEWYAGCRQRFAVPSMQSIWFGHSERIFGSGEERDILMEYTKKAIDFAEAIECKNLVFGCPRNRSLLEGSDVRIAIDFFGEMAEYAKNHHTVIGMEANPPIYNTNFLNTTTEALDFIDAVGSDGLRLNLDIGTMIENGEELSCLYGREDRISHVHISEPGLKTIEHRPLHASLGAFLKDCGYDGYVSIEMGKQDSVTTVMEVMKYVREQMQ